MSEAERKSREKYRKNRKRWIMAQAIVLVAVSLSIIFCGITYKKLNETVYITYTETSSVDYKVHLKDNEFYEEEWLGKDQAYVASLIDVVNAGFFYTLDMDVKNVTYEYSYKIEAMLEILDDNSHAPLFNPVYTLMESDKISQSSNNKLTINQSVDIDYVKYNAIANKFNETYGLTETTSNIIVRMNITVIGSCKDFEQNSVNNYVVSLYMPLTEKAITIEMQSTVPEGESKVLACDKDFNSAAFIAAILVLIVADVLLVIAMIAFIYLTRNEDINYAIKVQKLLSEYRSYIQKISNGFDTTGYQMLAVESFNEMLAIRDTIQSPILMIENTDKTRTMFLIPTNTKILYTHEIKVDNYDDIYGYAVHTEGSAILKSEVVAATNAKTVEEKKEEPANTVTEVVEEKTEEIVAEPEIEIIHTEEVVVTVSEEENETEKVEETTEEVTEIVEETTENTETAEKAEETVEEITETVEEEAETVQEETESTMEETVEETTETVEETVETTEEPTQTTEEIVEEETENDEDEAEDEENEDFESETDEDEWYEPFNEDNALVFEGLIAEKKVVYKDSNLQSQEENGENTETEETIESVSAENVNDLVSGLRKFPRINYSFEAKLALSEQAIRDYYKMIVDFALSYGVKVQRSWKWERIYLGRKLFAVITYRGSKLAVAFALDPTTAHKKYHGKDVSASKKYAKTPMLMRITSERKVKFTKEILTSLFNEAGIENKNLDVKINPVKSLTRKSLITKGLIKIKEEKR